MGLYKKTHEHPAIIVFMGTRNVLRDTCAGYRSNEDALKWFRLIFREKCRPLYILRVTDLKGWEP